MVTVERYEGIDVSQPVEVAPKIWWTGVFDKDSPFKCHSYLLDDGEEAVLFEPGSLLHYPSTFQKVIKIIPLQKIRYIVLSHQDPDVCGSLPAWEKALESIPVHVVTHSRTAVIIQQYGISSPLYLPLYLIDQKNWHLKLSSGRVLRFIFSPWCHSPGTFMTYDEESSSLFSGDIFGAITRNWSFYAGESYASAMRSFHEDYMACSFILQHALAKLKALPIERILPQHGSIINRDVSSYIQVLLSSRVGIDLLCGTNASTMTEKVSSSLDTENQMIPKIDHGNLPVGYRYIISRMIEREIGVLGKEDAISVAREVEGIHLDSEGNLIGIHEKDGREILNRLLKAYEERFGFWAIFNCRLMLHDLTREFGLKMPDILDRKVTNEG